MKHSDAAWVTLAVGVLTYEIAAPPGQLLSEAVDRYRGRHPVIIAGVIVYLAAHLLRIVPTRIDPLHQLAIRLKR